MPQGPEIQPTVEGSRPPWAKPIQGFTPLDRPIKLGHPVNPDFPVDLGPQPPTNAGGSGGTGSDPLSTLAAAYMASLGGGASGTGATAPIVIPPAASDGGTGVNWGMIGALAAVALVVWAVWTWWKKKHGGSA